MVDRESDTYICAYCGKTYGYAQTEEEAQVELKENFGDFPISECSVVCDDCYKKMGF